MRVLFQKITPNAIIPKKATEGSNGYDVYSDTETVIAPGDRALISTGIALAVPESLHVDIRPRSGLAIKNGVTVLNTPGLLDSDYRGEMCVILVNLGKEPFKVEKKMRVAQMVLMSSFPIEFEETAELPPTGRGAGGMGSSGVK